ncbi:hypothetical protein JXB27_02620 [Candidatus Woesearchaeota archaeon]|nr:hypothetical protein [Candidatus Woesearchaeota archaeon]
MFNEVTAILVAYLGVFIGLLLSKIAKEEVSAGKQNLINLEHLLRLLIIIVFFVMLPTTIVNKFVVAVILFVLAMFVKKNYYLFGLMLGMNPNFIMSSLVLIYGFPFGSLMHNHKYSGILKKTWQFLLFALIGIAVRGFI